MEGPTMPVLSCYRESDPICAVRGKVEKSMGVVVVVVMGQGVLP